MEACCRHSCTSFPHQLTFLIQNILKSLDENHDDYSYFERAFNELTEFANHINKLAGKGEMLVRLKEIEAW